MQNQLMRQLMMRSNLAQLLASRASVFSVATLPRSFYFVFLEVIIINFDTYRYANKKKYLVANVKSILYTFVSWLPLEFGCEKAIKFTYVIQLEKSLKFPR